MNKSEQNLWIFTELFYPDETSTSFILSKIANKLSEKYRIKVICGPESYDSSTRYIQNPCYSLVSNIKIIRVSTFNFNKNKILSRFLRHFFLSIKMIILCIKRVKKKDKVFLVTNPFLLIVLISIYKIFVSFELIILVHDVFPENLKPAGIVKSDNLFKLLKFFFDRVYASANKIIVLGEDMKEIISSKINLSNNRLTVIENWAEIGTIQKISRNFWIKNYLLDEQKLHIQYAGNLGRVQGLMEFLEILRQIDNPLLHFSFWGSGAMETEMKNFIQTYQIKNIYFHGRYSRNEQNKVLNSCDIALITLADGMYGLGVPSKTYNIMAAGKPILFIGDKKSEIGQTIVKNSIGFSFSPNEKAQIINFLNNLKISDLKDFDSMGKKSRTLAEGYFSEASILKRYSEFV